MGKFLKGFLGGHRPYGDFRTCTATYLNSCRYRFNNRIEKIPVARSEDVANLIVLPHKRLTNVLRKLLELSSIILDLILCKYTFIDRGVNELLEFRVLLGIDELESFGNDVAILLLKIVDRKRNRAVFSRTVDEFADDSILNEILERGDGTVVLIEEGFLAAAGTAFGSNEIDEEILTEVLEVTVILLIVMVRMFENKLPSEVIKAEFERVESSKIRDLGGGDTLNVDVTVSNTRMFFKKLGFSKSSVKEHSTLGKSLGKVLELVTLLFTRDSILISPRGIGGFGRVNRLE